MSEPPERPSEPEPPYQPYGQPAAYPPYGHPSPAYPYGVDPVTGAPISDKSKTAAGLLQLMLSLVGIPGVGRLYAGNTALGLGQLLGAVGSYVLFCAIIGFLTAPLFILWGIVDGIVILASTTVRDGNGRVMR
ncbi:hypothetical protein [Nocardioides sp. YIM 152588]|uniref:hypothetical protein n=1 Tax=Nocardioides sp. YIM 152588 TaxID=3158259 RepID=UPI0032E3A5C0